MTRTNWTQELFDETAQEIIDQFGCIPASNALDAKGYSGFRHAVSKYGPNMGAVRKRFDVQNVRLTSIDGQNWLSYCEVNTANMLLIRGIIVSKGRQYPEEYSRQYPRDHALYDLHFIATADSYADQEINCEIFGGPRGNAGSDQRAIDRYAETKQFKMEFHKNCSNFLGIDYKDCYDDHKILQALQPYIGDAPVLPEYTAKLPPVAVVALPVHDMVITECRDILNKLEATQLPPVPWFHRDRNYKDRLVLDWEPASWAPFVKRLHLLKISYVRQFLGDTHRASWTKDKVVDEILEWYRTHDVSPGQMALRVDKLQNATESDHALQRRAKSLENAARHYFKADELRELVKTELAVNPPTEALQSTRQRKQWSADRVVEDLVDWYKKHDIDPLTMRNRLHAISMPDIAQCELKSKANCLDKAICRYFGKSADDPKRSELMQIVTKKLGRKPAEVDKKERKWTADRVVFVMAEWCLQHDTTPSAMTHKLSNLSSPTQDDLALKSHASSLSHAVHRYFGKNLDAFKKLVDYRIAELAELAEQTA